MSQLPEGWTVIKLTAACELNPPKPKPNQIASNLPVTFVPMAAVDAELGAITNASIREYTTVAKGFTSFQEGDVIMAKITPCMENGKAAIARGLSNGVGFGSTEFHVFRSSGAVLPEYIFHFVRQQSFRKLAEANMTGTVGQKRVPASFLNDCDFPLPPLAEQRRIVAKLETLLGKVEACQQRLAKIPVILKRFRQAVLAAACSGELTVDWRTSATETASSTFNESKEPDPYELPVSWRWVQLPSLGFLGRGKSKHRPRNAEHLYGGAYPFIQTGEIARSGGRITQHKQTYSEAGLAQSKLWPEKTVCITIAANIADSALLTYSACFPDSVVGLITDSEICLPEYA